MTFRFCPQCATELQWIELPEDGGPKTRLRCPACDFTHWNNPTPVLAAVVQCVDQQGQVLLARNAAWPMPFYGLITGFMEAGETPEEGIRREVLEETSLEALGCTLIGVYDFQKKNQVLIAYHVPRPWGGEALTRIGGLHPHTARATGVLAGRYRSGARRLASHPGAGAALDGAPVVESSACDKD